VLEAKDYSYLQEMLCGAIEQTESASKVASHKEVNCVQVSQANQVTPDTSRHLYKDPPPQQDVIKERIHHSRFKTKKDDLQLHYHLNK